MKLVGTFDEEVSKAYLSSKSTLLNNADKTKSWQAIVMTLWQNRRIINDLIDRSKLETPVPAILWSLLIFTTDYFFRKPVLSLQILTTFMLVAFLRFLHQRSGKNLTEEHPSLNYALLFLSVLTPAIIWGSLFSKIMLENGHMELKLLMMTCTAGLCAGATNSYAPDRFLVASYLSIMLLPAPILLTILQPKNVSLILVIITLLGFLMALGAQGARQYLEALNNEIKLKEKTRELERLSEIDILTDINNRGYFDKVLEMEWKQACRDKNLLSLILLDIDYFKKINDTYGHLAGDQYLKELAQVLKETFRRATDVVARFGGEEFAILLVGTNPESTANLCEFLREKMEALSIEYERARLQATVSMGLITHMPKIFESPETLVAAADEALYRAKGNGRNQVHIHEGLVVKTPATPARVKQSA